MGEGGQPTVLYMLAASCTNSAHERFTNALSRVRHSDLNPDSCHDSRSCPGSCCDQKEGAEVVVREDRGQVRVRVMMLLWQDRVRGLDCIRVPWNRGEHMP